MANVLPNLAGDIYKAADIVSRELTGFIPSVTINANGSERAAVGDTIRSFVAPASTIVANTPAMTIPEGTDQTIGNKTMTITNSDGVQIPWTGEDQRHVNNGAGYNSIYGAQIEQAMRAQTNAMELALFNAIRVGSSRAYGTAGTTPFPTAGDYSDMAQTLKILKDNGATPGGSSLVVGTAAGASFLGKQADVNRQGTDSILRQGVFAEVTGNFIRESGQVSAITAGTGTSYTSSTAGFAIGSTSIAIITGTGTVLAGDVVTFAGDTNKYVVATGVAAPGTIVLAAPGLRKALAASAVAMTITAAHTPNLLVSRSAVELVIRPPSMPAGGDARTESMIVVDPRSGLPFELSVYKGFQKVMINVSAAYGVKVWKPEHIATLLG